MKVRDRTKKTLTEKKKTMSALSFEIERNLVEVTRLAINKKTI